MQYQRHIGRMKNTGSTLVVVMAEIPGREDHALVVETDSLPPKFSDQFADLVAGTDAQNTPDLGSLLQRRVFDYSGQWMMSDLHNNGHLRAMPIDNIDMLVTKNDSMPLTDIVNAMRSQDGREPLAGSPTGAIQPDFAAKTQTPAEMSASLLEKATQLETAAAELKKKAFELGHGAAEAAAKKVKRGPGRPKKVA